MYLKLCGAIKADISSFVADGGSASTRESPNAFQVLHEGYPVLFFQIQALPERAIISCVETRRKHTDVTDSRREWDIRIICTAQDKIYYRLDGEDYASEAVVSEILLDPLLEFIEQS
jgi:hypothetical protein